MHQFIRTFVLAALVVVIASGAASAQEKQKKKRKGRRAGAFAQVMKKAQQAELSDDEMASVKEVLAKRAPKMKEAQAAVNKIIGGRAGRKKMNEARKQASGEGKKGKELRAAMLAALDLNDEDAESYAKADAAVKKLTAEVRAELAKSLPEEKLAKLGMKGRQAGKGKKKKKDR